MRQLGIFLFCFIFVASFDFNPHEVIRKSRYAPVNLQISPRDDTAGVTYSIPTDMTANVADGLLQGAKTLAEEADSLMSVLQQLLHHFNDTEGEEIIDVRNMTSQLKAFDEEFARLEGLITEINATMTSNAQNMTYIETQVNCMSQSQCNIGPTTPPPPASYDCTVTMQNATKDGDSGSWTFNNPTTFENCSSLTITSKKGLWLNINVTVGGKGPFEIQESGHGSVFEYPGNTTASLTDIRDTSISIIIGGEVTFTLTFAAFDPCKTTDCGNGACSIDPSNQVVCSCYPCYFDQGDKKCSNYTNPNCDKYAAYCGGGSNTCKNFANSTACGYYCVCANLSPDCKPTYCPSDDICPDDSKKFDSRSFWKRHDFESILEEIDDEFDPYEFVQQAQEAETSLNFTMPDTITQQDPYILLQDATNLTNLANNLMNQLQNYLNLFNNTQNAPEENAILQYTNRLNNANATFGPLLDRYTDLKDQYSSLNTLLSQVHETITCYAASRCHEAPPTTTTAPPPAYDCSRLPNGTLSKAGDTNSISVPYVATFDNCDFTIKSTVRYGLWINLKFSNYIAQNSDASITIDDERENQTYTVASNQLTFNNLTSDEIKIHFNGGLSFTLEYSAIDPCAGFDCGNGTCQAASPANKPTCACSNCYTLDTGTGKCTVQKPNKCLQIEGTFCTSGGGTCHWTNSCDWYCTCPGLDTSCHESYCGGQDECESSKKAKHFFSKWFNFFN